MVQLFETTKVGTIGKRAALRGAIWSLVIHASVILFVLSLAFSPVLPTLPDHVIRVMLSPPPPPPAPPPPPLVAAKAMRARRAAPLFAAKLTAPVAIPAQNPTQEIAIEVPPDLGVGVIGGVPGGIPGGTVGGVLGGVLGGTPPPVAAPPPQVAVNLPAPPPAPQTPKRVQVSAELQEAQILEMIRPDYPKFAKVARVQGNVRLRAIIDRQGKITELKLIEGHPLLVPAAIAAVEKWRYRPTMLNGEAVEVATEIIVRFHLIS
jgi:protein TonB